MNMIAADRDACIGEAPSISLSPPSATSSRRANFEDKRRKKKARQTSTAPLAVPDQTFASTRWDSSADFLMFVREDKPCHSNTFSGYPPLVFEIFLSTFDKHFRTDYFHVQEYIISLKLKKKIPNLHLLQK